MKAEQLSESTLRLAKLAIESTWNVLPDDEPNLNAATLAWREIRAALHHHHKELSK